LPLQRFVVVILSLDLFIRKGGLNRFYSSNTDKFWFAAPLTPY
jgi:hypothetical protein